MAILPDLASRFDCLYERLWQLPQIPATTLELCRLRLAQLHGSEADWQREEQPIAMARRAALPRWPEADAFTAAERTCLEFTETYAMDAQAITDEQAAAVVQHHGEDGLVALVEALGILDGMTRLSLLWQLPTRADTQGGITK